MVSRFAAVQVPCLVMAGIAIGGVLLCALFGQIASDQESSVGCFVLGAVFFCLLATALLCCALA